MHTSHNIAGSEAFAAERFGSRVASQRPRQRIEAEPNTADAAVIAVGLLLAAGAFLAACLGAI